MKEDMVINHHGREVFASLFYPENGGVHRKPLVIISHGFGGCGSDHEWMAAELNQRGIACCCFDFCGGGNRSRSSLNTEQMTIFTEKEDLTAVLEEMEKRPQIDCQRIFLFGESQGGLVTALVAEEQRDHVSGMILLYPALCIPDDWQKRYPDLGEVPETLEWWDVNLSRRFVETIHDFHVFEEIGNYPGRVLLMHGGKDPVVPIAYTQKAFTRYQNAEYRIFPEEGHGFSMEAARRMFDEVVLFIASIAGTSFLSARLT